MLTYCEDLEYIVAAASNAGWLESEEKICVKNDTELTKFLFDGYYDWKNNDGYGKDFEEWITEKLIAKYGGW